METSKDNEIEQLEAQRATLASRQTAQQEQLGKLQSDREVLQDLAASRTFDQSPQPESGPSQQTPDAFASIAAQEQLARKQSQITEATGELAKIQTAMGDNADKLDRAVKAQASEIEQREAEGKTQTTEVLTDKGVEGVDAVTYQLEQLPATPDLPSIDVGGTGKHIGEAVAWGAIIADHLKTVGVGTAAKFEVERLANQAAAVAESVKAKVAEFADSVGTSPDHVERKNLEAEIAKHNEHADELDTLAQNFKRDLAEPGPVDVSDQAKDVRGEFESVANRANQLFEQQDKEMAELQVDTATDPAVRTTEAQVRETMAEEMILKRDEVTRELCQPVAELNVDERNARTLEDSAGLNKAHLERYGMKVANDPDGPQKVKNFASNLEQDQKELQNQLTANRSEAIQQEVHSLQGQHFPEVQAQAQALQGPGLQQSGPQQQGLAGPGQ